MKSSKFYKYVNTGVILIKSKYLTNFQINNNINYLNPNYKFIKNKINKNYINKKNKINKKILINYLFAFLYFLNHKIINLNFTLNINILPKKNNRFIMLSAPVKHKLPKHTLGFSRYFFTITFLIKIPNNYLKINLNTNFNLLHLNLFKFVNLYESNLYFNEKIQINLPVKYNSSFLLKFFFYN